tara:strand:- start:1158 stop:1529 length:372 start_codon:yes stop_codon:yes gene_type:complete
VKSYFLISIAGVLGILSRHFLELNFGKHGNWIPLGTFGANMLGCFIAGAIFQAFQSKLIDQSFNTILLVGFCGGLTTFSGYALGAMNDLSNGLELKAIIYLVTSPIIGVCFAFAGLKIIKLIA